MFTIDPEREKYILENMGIKYHHGVRGTIYCSKGTVTEWEYFGLMYEWASGQPFWPRFLKLRVGEEIDYLGPLYFPIQQEFINAELFANALFEFLALGEGEIDWKNLR